MSNNDSPLVSRSALPDFSEGQKLAGIYLLRRKVDPGPGEPIWLAFDEVLGKDVSLHFVPLLVRDDAPAMEALRHEVKRTRQLIHPNILRVYDLVEEPGWVAVSMDAFEAESVATMLRKSKNGFLEPSEVRGWLEQLCQTLQDTHKIQLVHRDLSLRNLFVDATGKLLITGFGISRTLKDALGRLQPVGAVEPGLAYMSPQQLDGERPSSADDIYAIGALLHEVLAGEPPFVGGDILPQIRRKPPAPITERREKKNKAAAAISPEWEKVAAACLEKSPEQRPKSVAEIRSTLASSSVLGKAAPLPPRSVETRSRDLDELRPAQLPIPLEPERFSERAAAKKTDTSRVKPVELLAAKARFAEEAKKSAEQGPKLAPADPTSRKTKISTGKPAADPPSSPPKTERSRELEGADALENAIPDHYPSFGPRRSSFPLTWIAAAAILLAIGIYGVFFINPPSIEKTVANPVFAAEETEYGSELTAVKNSAESESATESTPDSADPAEERTPVEGSDPAQAQTSDVTETTLIAANAAPRVETSSPAVRKNAAATPAPAPPAVTSAAVASDASIAAKAAALEKAQQAAEAAEQARQEMMKQQKEAEAAVVEARNSLEAKTKTAAPILKAAEELESARKKREEEMRAAELEAQKAQQIAVEKARAAEEAKKSLTAFETENKEKLAAQQKADAELKKLQKLIEEKQRIAAETVKAAEEAGARIAEQNAAIKKSEQELADARMAVQKAAEEGARLAAERRRNLESELEATRRMFKEKMEALEKALQETQPPAASPRSPAASVPTTTPEAVPSAAADRSPAAASVPLPPLPPAPAAVKPPTTETTLAMKTEPPKPGASATPAPAVKKTAVAQGGFQNSLGMRFAPVGEVLFSVWQTRVQDFEAFAKATGLKSNLWKDPGFKQGLTHPVVNVSWMEAVAFCKWLTVKEQKEGLIAPNQNYRLPQDLEWSRAVGLSDEVGKTPEERDMGVADVFPWGTQWPPPPGAGNFTGEETGSDAAIKGFDDGFAWTSPVGSFPPNKFGLYDMGGNVWQWCMDPWNRGQKAKVLRGASWYNGAIKYSLLSSCRVHAAPDSSTDNYGFRCVIATGESGRSPRR